ncbi:hypothetical protein [Desertibaculum subflavum]|uniref:hypothetical protein n=1 Tax=Desertibaculum subflavum TaxID=2268458 RepID=UPI000E66B6D8
MKDRIEQPPMVKETPRLRRVIRTPLTEIWNDERVLPVRFLRGLDLEDARALLKRGAVHLVIAEPGLPLRWIPPAECFRFWKTEAQRHIVFGACVPYQMPDGYAYAASEWEALDGVPIVVLTKHS